MRKLWYRFKIWLGLCEKICECGHPLSQHWDFGTGGLICEHFYDEPTYCHCLEFVWERGDEESDPSSKKFIDWA